MSWINRLRNHMRQEAQRAMADVATPRAGVVTNYDPTRYCARVQLQPEGILTGYLPITSMWVGNGWGMYSPPSIGEVVDVHFHQGGKEAAYIVGRFYSAKTQPLAVQSGEFWLAHQSGSFIKMTNEGDIIISAARDLINHAGRNYLFDANGQGQKWNGTSVETWQDNDVTGAHHDHAPPEIPD